MSSFSDLIQQGAVHAWLFIPSAILLGALHGLDALANLARPASWPSPPSRPPPRG